ncbi:MAG: DUF1207 domain-containing protein [Pirellulales bacterium]|nr:DUF1207 domain-containing protein [Pirellulales bacterium]
MKRAPLVTNLVTRIPLPTPGRAVRWFARGLRTATRAALSMFAAIAVLVGFLNVAIFVPTASAQLRLGPPQSPYGDEIGVPGVVVPQYDGAVSTMMPTPSGPAAPIYTTPSAAAPPGSITLDYGGKQYSPIRYEYCPPWRWQLLPSGLIYRSYLAGPREPRLGSVVNWRQNGSQFWDLTLGGRVGILRYGSGTGPRPDGFQLDIEGAAFPRLDLANNWDLNDADFRGGVPLTFGYGPWEFKLGYYHISSHLGDELLVRNPALLATRRNYVRDSIVGGVAYRVVPALRLYGEAAYAFHRDGGAEPWEFQFGVDLSSLNPTGIWGLPFLAVNGYLRQEVNFGGSLNAQLGWQWRGEGPGHLLRTGLQYFNGKTVDFSFFPQFEQQLGLGLWYDY